MSDRVDLVADIGATNARFAVHTGGQRRSVVLATTDAGDAPALLRAGLARLQVARPDRCCIAVAGPVQDGIAEITNGGLRFETAVLEAELGCAVHLVNDFFALARSVEHLESLRQIGGSVATQGVRVLVGPGSGLGMSILVPPQTPSAGWRVLASEGGHADLAAGNHLELEVLGLLHQRHQRVSWETVLSGPGLVELYRVVCEIWGGEARALTPEEISAAGQTAEDPVCHQTLELFFGWLGAAAGNLALTVCARGGVYIGGGIVPQMADFAESSPLRRRFEERDELEAFVRDIPIYIIMDREPGLTGAFACLQAPGTQGSTGVTDGA